MLEPKLRMTIFCNFLFSPGTPKKKTRISHFLLECQLDILSLDYILRQKFPIFQEIISSCDLEEILGKPAGIAG